MHGGKKQWHFFLVCEFNFVKHGFWMKNRREGNICDLKTRVRPRWIIVVVEALLCIICIRECVFILDNVISNSNTNYQKYQRVICCFSGENVELLMGNLDGKIFNSATLLRLCRIFRFYFSKEFSFQILKRIVHFLRLLKTNAGSLVFLCFLSFSLSVLSLIRRNTGEKKNEEK